MVDALDLAVSEHGLLVGLRHSSLTMGWDNLTRSLSTLKYDIMKYYIDTEFLEGSQKTFFGHTKPTIDLISIGIVAEDGREYYAISNEFNFKEAWNRYQPHIGQGDMDHPYPKDYWIRDNILKPICKEIWSLKIRMKNLHKVSNDFTFKNFKRMITIYGKSNEQIAQEIIQFCKPNRLFSFEGHTVNYSEVKNPEFYGYYSDYDWVVFCWLFGKMIDLPDTFPMYCRDLKQLFDEKQEAIFKEDKSVRFYNDAKSGSSIYDITTLKDHGDYPVQQKEHNALEDAKWNKRLHEFIISLK